MTTDLSVAIEVIWKKSRGEIHRRISTLEQAATALLAGELGDELRARGERDAHKLAGSLGMFGFPTGSDLAREVEQALRTGDTPALCGVSRFGELVLALREEFDTQAAERAAAQGGEIDDLAEVAWDQSKGDVLAQVAVIAEAVTDALSGSLTVEARIAAAREARNLASLMGTLGFALASKHACTLEHELGALNGPPMAELPRLAELTVELRRQLEAGHDASARTPALPHDEPPALLIVDDDPERGRALVAAADAHGVPALRARDLETARDLSAERGPEVVLLDLSVGDDPDAALRFLAETSPERPVMIVAGDDEQVDRLEVARRGGRGFLARGLKPAETIAAMIDLRERVRVRGTRVLAVDDDTTVLSMLQSALEEAGLAAATCADAAQFWDRLDEISPDLVVLDFDMPQISGPDLCRAMRNDSRWAGIPVIFLTSHTDAESLRTVFDAGGDDYLSKPFLGPEVIARVGGRIERVRLYRALADIDSLTGLLNRRKSLESLQTLLRMAARQHQPASIAVLDVDDFKSINDTYGHASGDALLRELGVVMRQFFRGEDVVARWGGDELVVGMYGLAGADARQRLGEFVEEVRGRRFDAGRITTTLSVGVADYPAHGIVVEELYRAADAALYIAKAEGGDRAVPAGREPEAGPAKVDVVIVEDDVVLGRLLEHALQTRGYRTRWITDGIVAAAELAAAQPELLAPLLLLDWDLPGLDGLRVLRTLRERGVLKRMRVIMLTARGAEGEVLEALEAGAVDHMTKPFSVPVLMQRVRRAMER